LDDWYMVRDDDAAGQLLEIARAVDADATRGKLRVAVAGRDVQTLKAVADDAEKQALPARTLLLLAESLYKLGHTAEAVSVLRGAQRHFPNDFWVQDVLGVFLLSANPPEVEEASRCFAAACAIRPDAAASVVNLGDTLARLGRTDEAYQTFHDALKINPRF